MFGKIENGRLVVAGRIIKEGNTTITNPTDDMLWGLGYNEVVYTDKPKYDEENEKLIETYTENKKETKIIVSYEIVSLTDEEHNEIIEQKIQQELSKVTIEDLINLYDGKKDATSKINGIKNSISELREKKREIKDEK